MIVQPSMAVQKKKRQDYASLLVLEASTSDIRPAVWKNNLSGHKSNKEGKDFKTLKRRINYMMKEKEKKGCYKRGIMGGSVGVDSCGECWDDNGV